MDTGVYRDHVVLAGGRIGETWNCLTDPCVMVTQPNTEAYPEGGGHGTGSAALLSAKETPYATHRGITRAKVNAYRCYRRTLSTDGTAYADLDGHAATLAIQKAIEKSDRVILVETQSTAPGWAAIAQKADRAYRSGSVVVAAAGNLGVNLLGSPGNARGAIAVGGYDVEGGAWYWRNSYGITERRFKPDLEAPSGCETAGGPGSTDMTALGASSGASPMVAGCGLLLRNFMMGTAGSIDAGKIYAALILGGTETGNFYQHGAGRFRMFPEGNLIEWGKVDVSPTLGKWIEIEVGDPATQKLACSAWWPENLEFDDLGYPLDTHNDVDLELYAPGASVPEVTSVHADGVFERLVASVGGRTGKWRLHVVPKDLVTASQTVFWAAGLDPVSITIAAMTGGGASSGACGCTGCSSGCLP